MVVSVEDLNKRQAVRIIYLNLLNYTFENAIRLLDRLLLWRAVRLTNVAFVGLAILKSMIPIVK